MNWLTIFFAKLLIQRPLCCCGPAARLQLGSFSTAEIGSFWTWVLLAAAKLLLDCWTATVDISTFRLYFPGVFSWQVSNIFFSSQFHLVFDLVFSMLTVDSLATSIALSSQFFDVFCGNSAGKRKQNTHISMSGGQKELDEVKRNLMKWKGKDAWQRLVTHDLNRNYRRYLKFIATDFGQDLYSSGQSASH